MSPRSGHVRDHPARLASGGSRPLPRERIVSRALRLTDMQSEGAGARWLGRLRASQNTFVTKALSIHQPWAWAILHADKDLESR
jgi:hypothetical protein